jgi:hypothetical protein
MGRQALKVCPTNNIVEMEMEASLVDNGNY